MSNRLTNCDKWTDTWFSNLSPTAKLIFIFLYENCDNAGVYEINKKFMLFLLGLNEEELKEGIVELKSKYIKSKDDKRIWLVNFLKHQKKLPLNPKNRSHKQVIMILEDNISDATKFKGVKEMVTLIPVDPDKTVTKKAPSAPAKKFVKPSVDEIEAFMKEKEFQPATSEANRFWNWFESNGWKVGKNPMKVWKGAVNTWMDNWYERNKIKKKPSKLDNIKEAHENLDGVDWNKVYAEPETTS